MKANPKFRRGWVVVARKTEHEWHKGEVGKIVKVEFAAPSCRNRNEYLFEVRGACQARHFFFADEIRRLNDEEIGPRP